MNDMRRWSPLPLAPLGPRELDIARRRLRRRPSQEPQARQGTAWQVDASKTQGEADVTVRFTSDGTWKASTGASGIGWLAGDRVVLRGMYPGGDKIRYTLKQRDRADGHELWGIVEANFGPAAVSLTRLR